jgi:hypothetical protein
MMPHLSDSAEQRRAEHELVHQLSAALGVPLESPPIELGEGVQIVVDGFNREHRILCEVYAHIGPTRGGQPHKIANDILKMLAAEKRLHGQWSKILCFADKAAAQCVCGRSWLATVCSDFSVEIKVFSLPADLHAAVVAAQQRQVMVNPL